MKRREIKSIVALAVAVSLLATIMSACSQGLIAQEESTTKETTTTTTTKVTTTEDENTTFKENSTLKIYKGLNKNTKDDYPYKLATYTSHYRSSDTSRTANLKAAAGKLNNIVIPDGESFSFNQTVGKRTVTAGYQTAKVITNGDFTDGLGGGVCQVSSTLFECVLRANVEIISRTYHTLEIGYVPLGGDATVQWNSKDFKFKNTTGTDVRIKMSCENGSLTCTLYGEKDVDAGDVKISISHSGDSYVLTRTVNGKQNYKTVSRYKKPKPSTTKSTTKKKDDKTSEKGKDKTTEKPSKTENQN